jgi:hypothetical protein
VIEEPQLEPPPETEESFVVAIVILSLPSKDADPVTAPDKAIVFATVSLSALLAAPTVTLPGLVQTGALPEPSETNKSPPDPDVVGAYITEDLVAWVEELLSIGVY